MSRLCHGVVLEEVLLTHRYRRSRGIGGSRRRSGCGLSKAEMDRQWPHQVALPAYRCLDTGDCAGETPTRHAP
jgi:hypothetical protein